MTTLDLTTDLPNGLDYDISQYPTESFLYLTSDEPLGDEEFSDLENTIPADSSLLMELVRRIDESRPVPSEEPDTKFESDLPNTSAYPSHSTPLTADRHKKSHTPNETEKLFKLYQPLVNEELRSYINRLVGSNPKNGVLRSIDEVQEKENESVGSENENSNQAGQSPDTTPPTSQDHIAEHKSGSSAAIPAISLSDHPDTESDSVSVSVSVSQSDTDFDTSYVPKSVKSKLSSPDLEDRHAIVPQLELIHQVQNLEKVQRQMEERHQIEISQLKNQLEKLAIQKDEQLENLKDENLNLRVLNGELEINLMKEEENKLDSMSSKHDKSETLQAKIDLLMKENINLRNKLSNSKVHNTELNNEINFLRKKDTVIPETPVKGEEILSNERTTIIEQSDQEVGDQRKLISMETIEPQFRSHYMKFKLDEIDNLNKFELSNLLKNIMLTLLTGDLATLPIAINKFARVLKLLTIFMDKVHGIVYDDSETGVRPSVYIKAPHQKTDIDKLENCLGEMVRVIEQRIAK
ncbi:hypothetical protein CLIB1423_35S00738 [[Candida] railenensis]|uniref:Uncharacterized protein n=1 Tax=[Candida] railenensis TaxID=45579 RepID=A0A9P0QUE7_9ASCO|nr:hypothetical protein CLIB1423_35S00738 [[Candida] railenensis]